MKLIIDIDEQHFELLQMAVMNGMGDNAQKIIAQGIPLPKGHGRLIDAKAYEQDIRKHYFDNNLVIRCTEIALDNAPTIIEADTEIINETDS